MKLHTERKEVERSNVGAETAFAIRTTAKAFDILSSGLYTDNILAVVRELSCNAYDAHVAANNSDTPFEIHLPNSMEPWFHVKDQGTGLSDEDVMQLYTTYFDSTKTNSNDYIGALGLGSKSPFSYANAYEVISRFNNKRRTYSVFINEDGVPTIAKMAEVDSVESNGLEVKLAVRPSDFNEFRTKTARALKWFPVKPKVIGVPHFMFDTVPDHRIKGTGWHLLPRNYSDANMTAIQGNVAYAVNLSHIQLDGEVRTILSNGHLVCHFNIGDLEVAASREEIRYDDRSKQALLDRIAVFQQELVGEVEKQAKLLNKSFWHATLELNDISKKMFGSHGGLRVFLDKSGGSKNKTLTRYCEQNGRLLPPSVNGWDMIVYRPSGKYGMGKTLSRKHVGSVFAPKGDMAVFVNDVNVGGVSRLNNFIKTTEYGSVLAFRRKKDAYRTEQDDEGNFTTHTLTETDYRNEYKEIVKAFGDPDIKLVSKDTEKVKRMASGGSKLPVFQFNGTKTSYNQRNEKVDWQRIDPDEFDIEDGGLYLSLRNGSHMMTTVCGRPTRVSWTPRTVRDNLQTMIAIINKNTLGADFTIDDVYAVGATAVKQFEKRKNWHNIFDLIRPLVPKYMKAIVHYTSLKATSADLGIKDLLGHEEFAKRVRGLDKDSVFRQNIMPIITGNKRYKNDRAAAEFLWQFDSDYGIQLFENAGNPYYTKGAFDCYPMLTFVGTISIRSYDRTNLGVLFDYIKMIDSGAKS